MNGRSSGLSNSNSAERVIFVADASHSDRFFPQISESGTIRAYEPDDMQRVMDFDGLAEPPKDGALKYCEDGGMEGLKFPVYHCCLRGGYLFYFDVQDVEDEDGPYSTYHAPPVGVVPLSKCAVNFPPGGRRVFREHAQTDARSGYELVILHVPDDDDEEETRPPVFLVTESLGQREKWAAALRTRAELDKPTILRAGYSKTTVRSKPTPAATAALSETTETAASSAAEAFSSRGDLFGEKDDSQQTKKLSQFKNKNRESRTVAKQVMEVSDDADLAQAVVEFGDAGFNEQEWMTHFFQTHNDFDAPTRCRQMEHWQSEMKKSLKGAVLEQYEYFVQASGEMTTMGREVASLKNLIETQAETIKEMKDIDFSGALKEHEREANGDNESGIFEPPRLNKRRIPSPRKDKLLDEESEVSGMSSVSSPHHLLAEEEEDDDDDVDAEAPPIDIPEWLEDVEGEISAFVRECRYNDAVELYNKAKAEITDLMDKHERPTAYRLKKKQLALLEELQRALIDMGKRISTRLIESLRRKNEAFKQASKRERSDPHSASVTVVSPCALNDDALFLQLLVKLGRTQDAAEAFSARRSLLLLEALHERPISGAGSVDLVIYAAQLSQSFFSCLANSVEGFLDLFMVTSLHNDSKTEELSLTDSSLHSLNASKNIPAGAVASIVLWCDTELSKFASAFGGTRILANLALSPPPRDGPRKPRVVGQAADDINGSKERKNAIEVAAQCIDQAFLYASENLDSVGLPLTPRLAAYLRSRLKGCEAEVSQLLDDRWQHLTADWRMPDFLDNEF